MELTWIDDFLALALTRNFTRAADSRCTTQSAYSRRIQRLERWLGTELVDREARPLRLTPAGEAFLARAQRLREDMLDTRRAALAASSHFKRTLRIYTTNTLAAHFLTPWIQHKKLSGYSLVVASVTGCLEAVRRGTADGALIPHFGAMEDFNGLEVEAAGTDRLIFVASASVQKAVALTQKKLSGPLLAYAPGTLYGAEIAHMLQAHKIQIQDSPLCESASAEALLAQAQAGLGAAWIPSLILTDQRVKRCPTPSFFDLPYRIVWVQKPQKD